LDDIRWAIARELPYLRRYARSLVGDAAVADDLVQTTLERALRKHHLWLRRGSLRSWLFRILYRTFLNERGRRRRDVALDDVAETDLRLSQAPAQESESELRNVIRAMYRLPLEQRAALVLVVIEGLSYDETAEVLGVPVGTVRSRLSRARDTLRAWSAVPESVAEAHSGHLRRVK